MATIRAAVGAGGQNLPADVKVVQKSLNPHNLSPLRPLSVDGIAGRNTVAAIRHFQDRHVGMSNPDGRVDPGGRTLRRLNRRGNSNPSSSGSGSNRGSNNLSGTRWWRANQSRYPNSRRLEDLEDTFKTKATQFVEAIRNAGANVSIGSTRRNRTRAHLMHYSWKVSRGQIAPADVPRISGLNIEWDHGDDEASRRAAAEMVRLFRMAFNASLTSNHIAGKAIDMTISWNGNLEIKTPNGYYTITTGPRHGGNRELQRIGKQLGVIKLRSDPPHWSYNGR